MADNINGRALECVVALQATADVLGENAADLRRMGHHVAANMHAAAQEQAAKDAAFVRQFFDLPAPHSEQDTAAGVATSDA